MNFWEVWNENVHVEVQRAIFDTIVAEYSHCHAEVNRRYEDPEARDVERHIRRANIESALLELPERFPGKVSINTGTTQRKNHYRYAICGKLVLTQSYVEHNRRVPRESVFRNGFAGNPNQMLLNPEDESERVAALVASELIYVIITHSPSLRCPAEPSHVTAVFVDKYCKPVASIDLERTIAALKSKEVEVDRVEDRRDVKLRKGVAAKRNEIA